MSKEILISKITLFKKYKKELLVMLQKKDLKDEEFYIIERLFQLVVDEAVDINSLIIEREKEPIPDYNQSTFETLKKINVFKKTDVSNIANSVGLRNRIVHRYESVQKSLMLKEILRYLKLYDIYFEEIVNYCDSLHA